MCSRFFPVFGSGTRWNSSLRPCPVPLTSSYGSSGCRAAARSRQALRPCAWVVAASGTAPALSSRSINGLLSSTT